MKIVHLLKHAVRGNGSVHLAVDLACAQAEAGHDVWFASARGDYDNVLASRGVHVTDLPEPDSKRHAIDNAVALAKLVRRVKPDVLHAHMMSSAVIALPVSLAFRAPLVTTMHNSFDAHSWLMRAGRRVVAVSEAERRLLRSRRYPDWQVVTVLNGTAGSAREGLPFDDIGALRRPSVTTLSGLHPRKAVDDVVEGFRRVAEEHPAWHLNILGWGPSQQDLERQVESAGLEDRVHFLGATVTPWPYLAESDVVVTASLADPCPLTVMEARVAGAAVVGTRVGGIPEVLGYGAAGHLVDTHAPGQLADAFRELMSGEGALGDWRERARRGSERFTVARMQRDYDDVYGQVLPRRRRGGSADESKEARRPRVAYVVPPSPVFAGIERVVHELASTLAREHGDEFDVHVAFASHYEEPELADVPYTKHELGVPRLMSLAGPLRRFVRRAEIDLLVVPQVEASTVAWVATRGARSVRLVPHLHGNPQVEEADGNVTTKLAFVAYRAWVARSVSAVLAVSPSLARYAAAHLSSRAPVHFAKNPVRDLRPTAHERTAGEPFTFVSVARLARQKGQDQLLRAFALAAPHLDGARLRLVGDGPMRDELRELAASLGLGETVEFVGYVSAPEDEIAASDCFVLASRWEGFGVALVEALQCGVPVLATDCDFGPADIITDPALGEVVPVDDVSALAAGLVRARQRQDTDADRSRRLEAAKEYLPSQAAASHAEILRGLLGSERDIERVSEM
ncbi:glycosyltransferase [Demequina sp. NBRC 110052]|uniref:glycosyltransferase n=1 Tax=Demequina sp. NBRC 110052 TaxID=1570341 RepID=UPI0013566E85|nr:glycosyltransferase [Demequina sp. NBRC 110052]